MEPQLFSPWFIFIFVGFAVVCLLFLIWLISRNQKGKPINPVAEANVYLAYGRKQQAMEVLKNALASDPSNQEVLARLREIEVK